MVQSGSLVHEGRSGVEVRRITGRCLVVSSHHALGDLDEIRLPEHLDPRSS